MKIKSLNKVGKKKVYDITINSDKYDEQNYVLENGVISHNTGGVYSADNIWILGRQQDKDGQDLSGYHFVINVEKSRYVKEKSKIPITISFKGGINKWSGLLDLALEAGYIQKPKVGWYCKVDPETGEVLSKNYRAKEIENNKEFWMEILKETDLAGFIERKYKMAVESIMEDDTELSDQEVEQELEEMEAA